MNPIAAPALFAVGCAVGTAVVLGATAVAVAIEDKYRTRIEEAAWKNQPPHTRVDSTTTRYQQYQNRITHKENNNNG